MQKPLTYEIIASSVDQAITLLRTKLPFTFEHHEYRAVLTSIELVLESNVYIFDVYKIGESK